MKMNCRIALNVVDTHIEKVFFSNATQLIGRKNFNLPLFLFKVAGLFFALATLCLPIKNSLTLTAICLGSICSIAGGLFSMGNTQEGGLKQLFQSPIAVSALALFCVIALSYSYSDANQTQRFKYIFSYRELVFMPLIMLAFYHVRQYQRWALMSFMLVMSVIVVLSVINYFYPLSFASSVKAGAWKDSYITHSHIIQNVFSALLALVVLLVMRHQKTFSIAWFILGVLFLLSIIDVLFLVRGRTGQLILAAETFVFILIVGNKKVKMYSVVVLLLLTLLLFKIDNSFKGDINRTHTELSEFHDAGKSTSAGVRIAFWKYAFTEIKKTPLLGHGAGMYWKDFSLVTGDGNRVAYLAGLNHPHNEFLFIWHNAGLLALLLYISLISALLWQGFKTGNKDLQTVRLSIAIGLIIYSLIDVPFYNSAEGMFYALMIAVFFELKTPKNDSVKSLVK
jgi:O-antigen ligase